MGDIHIVQEHAMSAPAARAAARQAADKLAADYGVACVWEGEDVVRFERSGVQGSLVLGEQCAALRIELGMMMGAFAPMVQAKAAQKMQKVFGGL